MTSIYHKSFKEVYQQLEDRLACFKLVKESRKISLLPKCLGDIRGGVTEQLESMINLYSLEHEGIVIAYDNLQLKQSVAVIFDDQACVHVDIQVDLIIFQPTHGCELAGRVNKIGKNHIGCLVHDFFNASMELPQEPNKQIQQNKIVHFTVRDVSYRHGVISIKGDFLRIGPYVAQPNHTKQKTSDDINHIITSNQDSCPMEDTHQKKKKRKTFENITTVTRESEVTKINDMEKPDISFETPTKKHKKNKDISDVEYIHDKVDFEEDSIHKSSKGKHKKKKSRMNDELEVNSANTSDMRHVKYTIEDHVNLEQPESPKKNKSKKRKHSSVHETVTSPSDKLDYDVIKKAKLERTESSDHVIDSFTGLKPQIHIVPKKETGYAIVNVNDRGTHPVGKHDESDTKHYDVIDDHTVKKKKKHNKKGKNIESPLQGIEEPIDESDTKHDVVDDHTGKKKKNKKKGKDIIESPLQDTQESTDVQNIVSKKKKKYKRKREVLEEGNDEQIETKLASDSNVDYSRRQSDYEEHNDDNIVKKKHKKKKKVKSDKKL